MYTDKSSYRSRVCILSPFPSILSRWFWCRSWCNMELQSVYLPHLSSTETISPLPTWSALVSAPLTGIRSALQGWLRIKSFLEAKKGVRLMSRRMYSSLFHSIGSRAHLLLYRLVNLSDQILLPPILHSRTPPSPPPTSSTIISAIYPSSTQVPFLVLPLFSPAYVLGTAAVARGVIKGLIGNSHCIFDWDPQSFLPVYMSKLEDVLARRAVDRLSLTSKNMVSMLDGGVERQCGGNGILHCRTLIRV